MYYFEILMFRDSIGVYFKSKPTDQAGLKSGVAAAPPPCTRYCLYGLSPAVVHYWRLAADGIDDDISLQSLSLSLQDIPDIDLRGYITEVIF